MQPPTANRSKNAAIQPDVVLSEEAEVTVVDVKGKVRVVAVEGDDLALRVGRHPIKEDTLVVFHALDSLLLCLTGEVHLVVHIKQCIVRAMWVNLVFRRVTCTDLNGEDGCIPDQERFDLEGLAEGSSLVHGAHRCGLICVDVLSQLLSEGKNSYSCRY